MGKNVVQISLSDSEYEKAMELAKEKGLSLPLFFKSRGLDIQADNFMEELLVLVATTQTGWFNVRQVFGAERWGKIDDSRKRLLGKCFFFEVERGKVPLVRAAGKDAANTQWYYKGIDLKYYEQKVSAGLIEEIERFMALPVAEVDRMKAFDYVMKLSTAFAEGSPEFDAEVKKITDAAQDCINNGEWSDMVVFETQKRLDRMKLAQNGYAVKLFDQLFALAEKGRRS